MYYPQEMDLQGKQNRLKKQSKSTERAANGKAQQQLNTQQHGNKKHSEQQILDAISKSKNKNSLIGQTVKTQKSSALNQDLPSSFDGEAQQQTTTGNGERGSIECPEIYKKCSGSLPSQQQKHHLTSKNHRVTPMSGSIANDDDGEEDADNILDPYSNSAEYFLEEVASREAYFGESNGLVGAHAGTLGSFQGHGATREIAQIAKTNYIKRNTASMANHANHSGTDSNLNLSSPVFKAFNSKSAKGTTKATRKREPHQAQKSTSQHSKVNGATKTQRKKLNDLGMVYDSKTMMVPAINGAMIRTSNQDLRAMNGYSAQQQLHHGKSSLQNKSSAEKQQSLDDNHTAKKRQVSQSPQVSLAYKTPKMNQLVASNLPGTEYSGMLADKTMYQANREPQKQQIIPGTVVSNNNNERNIMTDYVRNSNSHKLLNKMTNNGGSISARSDKNSLPEICNRSVNNDGSSFTTDQMTATHINGDESGAILLQQQQSFYPSPKNHFKRTGAKLKSSVPLQAGQRPDPAHEITISEDNIALASFNQSCIDQTTLTIVDCNTDNTKETQPQNNNVPKQQPIINLPKIAAKQTVQKAVAAQKHSTSNKNARMNSTVRASGSKSSHFQHGGAPSNSNNNIISTRTTTGGPFQKGPSSDVVMKSPRVIRGALATTIGQGFNKRGDSNNPMMGIGGRTNKVLDPIQITEEANNDQDQAQASSDEMPIAISKQESKELNQQKTATKQQRNSAGTGQQASNPTTLKPLNHTPNIVKKSQNPLISASKTFFNDVPQSQQNSAKLQTDFRKTQNNLGLHKRVSIHDNSSQSGEKPEPIVTNGLEQSERKSILSRTEEEKMQSITSGTKVRDRSPIRQATSLERIPGQGSLLRKDLRDIAVIAQSQNAEPFYRRAMKKLNWNQVPQNDTNKTNFHIRFNIGDLEGSSKDLQPKHFYNHFPQNRELVTKMGLCKNLWFNCFNEQEHRISHMFPRCYDLSVPQQAESFISDFNQTAILSIVKTMANHFMKRNKEMKMLLAEYEKKALFEQPERLFKPNFKKLCHKVDMRTSGVGNLLGISEVRDAYSYSKHFSNSLVYKEPKKNARKRFSRASLMKIDESQIQAMIQFQSLLVENGVPQAGFASYEQFKLVRLHKTLEQLLPQYRQIDGTHNIWIVKPSYNARGLGIYCTRLLRDILKDAERTQQKVVQKYIERPFCIEGSKKFDFRQWVLVNNWEPLDVCVFSSAYLKVCGSEFDLKQIGDVFRHLSNYSIQKENGDKIDLVMSSTQFEEFMRQSQKAGLENFTWQSDMLPKINDVVWRTLKSVQENLEQKSNCFEVYGFDIVLDEDLNPWVIEVNLSPACTERADWLTKMLDDSCIDLLKHIQSRILISNPAESWAPEMLALREQATLAPHRITKNLNSKQFYEENQLDDRWIRLEESIQEIKDFNKVAYLTTVPQKGIQLELVSEKADLKFERKLDRGYRQEMCAIDIQKTYRGYLGRKIYIAKLKNKCAIIIQKNVRTLLAKCELIRLRQKRAATIVQKQLRRILACRVARQLEAERIFRLKTILVTKLQTLYRMSKAKTYVHSVRQNFASIRCQRYLRGYLTRSKAKIERTRKCFIVRIQRFYKRRFRLKMQSACLVQRKLKGLLSRKRVKKLKKITHGSQIILKTYQEHLKKQSLRKFRCHSKAVKIQAFIRMVLSKIMFKRKLKELAQAKIRKFLRKRVLEKLKQFAANLKQVRSQHAIVIQKRLRGYLAFKRLGRLKMAEYFNSNATTVKRFMKGYLGKKEAKRRRIKIGAAIMIQSLFRGFAERKILRMKLMWEQEQLEQKKQARNEKARKHNEKRGSDMKHYMTKGGGRFSQNANYNQMMNTNGSSGYSPHNQQNNRGSSKQNQQLDERSSRYQSNPSKFISNKSKGSIAHQNQHQRGLVNKTGSQGSLRHSESRGSLVALRNDDHQNAFHHHPASTSNPGNPLKFQQQQSGKQKRKVVKKGMSTRSGAAHAMNSGGQHTTSAAATNSAKANQHHYELGLIHLYQNQQLQQNDIQQYYWKKDGKESGGNAYQQTSNGTGGKRNSDKRYSLQRVYKMEQKAQPPARLGSKIASNLNKQKVENLMMTETSSGFNLNRNHKHPMSGEEPEKKKNHKDSGNVSNVTNSQQVPVVTHQQKQQLMSSPSDFAPTTHQAKDSFDERLDRIIMETMNERENIIDQKQQELQQSSSKKDEKRSTVTNKHLSIETKKISDCLLNQNASNAGFVLTPQLKSKATKTNSEHQSDHQQQQQELKTQRSGIFLKPIDGHVKVRQSFEMHNQIEQQLEPQVIASGLGKEQNVKAVSTHLNKSLTGKGVATTVVMRKDPSRGSLNTGRENQPSSSQQQHEADRKSAQQSSSTQNAVKKAKEKSKQIKTLEKLVQHGAAYMHPQARPALKRNTTQLIRDKISDAQQKSAASRQIPNSDKQSQQPGQNKSFAKYLNDMLENQARQSNGGNSILNAVAASNSSNNNAGGAADTKNQQQEQHRHYHNGSDGGGGYAAFHSGGKNSMSGTRMHQPEFKPVLVKNGQMSLNNSGMHQTSFASNGHAQESFNLEVHERLTPTNQSHIDMDSFIMAQSSKERAKEDQQNYAQNNTIDSSESKKSEFAQRFEEVKYQRCPPAQHTYSQAMAVFNKTKNNYLQKIKKSQEKRIEAVNSAHQRSFSLLYKGAQTGASVPANINQSDSNNNNKNKSMKIQDSTNQSNMNNGDVSENRKSENKQNFQSKKSNSSASRSNPAKLVVI